MHFGFTEEQLMIQDVARRIAQEKIAPSAEHHDRTAEFPLENIRLLGENGLMGIEVPAEYGGAGMDPIASGSRLASDRVAFDQHSFPPISRNSTRAQPCPRALAGLGRADVCQSSLSETFFCCRRTAPHV